MIQYHEFTRDGWIRLLFLVHQQYLPALYDEGPFEDPAIAFILRTRL